MTCWLHEDCNCTPSGKTYTDGVTVTSGPSRLRSGSGSGEVAAISGGDLPANPAATETPRHCPTRGAVLGTLRQYWCCDLPEGHGGQHVAYASTGLRLHRWGKS